jgi:hypothetical protein
LTIPDEKSIARKIAAYGVEIEHVHS